MNRSRYHRRTGFTLIELLVVISLIALLLALSAGAFFKIRSSQVKQASIATVKKVDGLLHARVSAIQSKAKDEIRDRSTPAANAAISDAGGDKDVALTLLLYAKMKNELPMTFNEARGNTIVGSITLLPKKHFTTAIGAVASAGSPEESGVLLFLALTNSAGDGAVVEAGLEQQAITTTISGTDFRTFGDSWGTPLAFVRQCYTGEVQSPPYVKGAASDPFDPSPTHKAAGKITWAQIAPPAITGFNAPARPSGYSSTVNFVPTVISAGPNKVFADFEKPPAVAPNSTPDIFNPISDNLYGFRLRREGSQGN